MEYLAHITGTKDKRIEQTCKEHMDNVARYAKERLETIDLGWVVYYGGKIHDLGKLKQMFGLYLSDSFLGKKVYPGQVNHSSAGCIWILEKYLLGNDNCDCFVKAAAEIISYIVACHHGVQDSIDEDGGELIRKRLKHKEDIAYDESVNNYFNQIISEKKLGDVFEEAIRELGKAIKNIASSERGKARQFQIGLLTRLCLSAVVDADRRDTMEFMLQIKTIDKFGMDSDKQRKIFWNTQVEYYENKIKNFEKERSVINGARKKISERCLNKATEEDGIYKLDVPTGAGKTLASLRYALNHACKYNKRRVIYVIPLLTVLEQNRDIIKNYISDSEAVLEHHSNVIRDKYNKDELDEYELLTENWQSPIVITTMVQFLNTLFSNKMSSVRRMQALCDSVIIIDEVQSVPLKLTSMFNIAMNFLQNICKCSIVLCSATQPAFSGVKNSICYAKNPDMVKMDEINNEIGEPFRRTRVINKVSGYGMSIDELADFTFSVLEKSSSILIVCNTKNSALKLTEKLKLQKDCDTEVFHLSTSMCQKHRIDIMDRLNELLKQSKNDNSKKVICVSTQLIEAGVDISFNNAIRIVAGIDSVVQTAGRCNRSNEYKQICDVYIVNLKKDEENLMFLKEIQNAQMATIALLEAFSNNPEKFDNDILSTKSIEWYYKKLYKEAENELDYKVREIDDTLFNLLSVNNKRSAMAKEARVLNQSFKDAGERFKIFDDNTVDIIVPYNDKAVKLINDLCSEKAMYDLQFVKECIEEVKEYTIHVFEYQRKILDEQGVIHSCCDGNILYLDKQCYDKEFGLYIDGNSFY